jgi:hypothetical protein
MPNHLHGIMILNRPEGRCADDQKSGFPPRAIGVIVAGHYAAVSVAAVRQVPGLVGPVWQRGFHNQIIRSHAEPLRWQRYIANNLAQRELDRYFNMEVGAAAL